MTTTDVFQGVGAKNSSRVLAAPGGKSSICFGNPDDSPPAPARRSTDNGAAQDSPAGQGTPAPNAHSHSSIFGEGTDAETPDSLKVKKVSKGSGQYNPNSGDGHCSGYNVVTGQENETPGSDKVSPRQKYANDQTRGSIGSADDPNNSGMPPTRVFSARAYKNSQYRGAYNPITGELYEDSPLNADDSGKKPGEKGRGDFNPITGEAYVPKKEVHTSTRVRQPPGGASSKLW